jgi:hypothetical protein
VRGHPACSALTRLGPLERAGDVRDVVVAEVEQVPGGQPRTSILVDAGRYGLSGRDPLHEDDRHRYVECACPLGRSGVRNGHDERLDRLVEQPVDAPVSDCGAKSDTPTRETSYPAS